MAGLLLELRRQIRNNHRRNASNSGKTPRVENQRSSRSNASTIVVDREPEIDPVTIEHIYERNLSIVSRDDILLKQIDEFRERAQQLQDMLDSRESEAEELKSIVDERKEKAQALDQILKEQQEKADGLSVEVEKHIDALIQKVGVRLEQIESSIKNEVGVKMDRLEMSMKEDVGSKIDRLGMVVNNSLSNLGNQDSSALVGQLETSFRTSLSESVRITRDMNTEQTQEMRDALSQIQEQLTAAKGELSEKMHSETVKCYRNIQELYKGMDEQFEKMNQLNEVDESVKSAKQVGTIAMILGLVNLAGILGLLLMSMGIF